MGGRCATVNAYESPLEPVELGASIFVKVNHNIVSAVERLGLSTQGLGASMDEEQEEDADDLGVWDGLDWVFYLDEKSPSWWNAIKIIWNYGLAPLRTRNLMKSTVGKFLKMYSEPYFPFRDLSETAYELGLTDVTAVTGEQYLAANNIGEAFGRNLIQASTRVNYAQNLDRIHGLETMVCMATDGAMSIKGGNWQVFAGMVAESQAKLKLNTTVTGVRMDEDGKYHLGISDPIGRVELSDEAEATYDSVILAAPYQFADLSITPEPQNPPEAIPYVGLHVTLFTSPYLMNPQLFGMKADARVPSTILTTLPGPGEAIPKLDFYSISRLRTLTNPHTGRREYLYKIFSPQTLSTAYISALMDINGAKSCHEADRLRAQVDGPSDDDKITWLYRKFWHSYPVELPRITFESSTIRLDGAGKKEDSTVGTNPNAIGKETGEGKLWYTAGIESFISTMETSSLMGMNVARLIVDDWNLETESG